MALGDALARGISGVAQGVSAASQSWPQERMGLANLEQRQLEFEADQERREKQELDQRKLMRFKMDQAELGWADEEVARLSQSTSPDREALTQAIIKRDSIRARLVEYADPTTPQGVDQSGPGRPMVQNEDGTVSTERSITVTDPRINDSQPTNIPSMFDGVQVEQEEAINRISVAGGVDPETGRPLPGFDSIEDAVAAAEGRSAALGAAMGMADSMISDTLSAQFTKDVKKQMVDYASKHGPAGASGALAYGSYLMGRDLTQEEIDASMPSLLGAMPVHTIDDGMFKLIMGVQDLQERRRALFEWTGSDNQMRMRLMAKYGSLMNIPVSPPKVDPYASRKALDVQVPLVQLDRMQRYINQPEIQGKMGPVSGTLHGANPWDTEMGVFKAVMMGSTQIIGKFLEGGVLRQEDTAKYRAILPNYKDTPEIAQGKLDNLSFILRAMERLYKTGTVTTTFDDEGKEVPMMTFPDLPWNPGSENVPLEEISQWLTDNQDHDQASEVMQVLELRAKIRRDAE